jgi:hypothetical protein
MLWKALSLVVLLCLAFGLTAPQCAYACTCLPIPPVPEAVERSTAVFAARVTDIKPAPTQADQTELGFSVSRVWKGPVVTTLSATTSANEALCGYEFVLGREYLVYAVGDPNALQVYLCSRTQPITFAGADLAILGPGVEPGRLYLPHIMLQSGQD